MKLPFRRSKSKKAKAADVLGSVAKLWSELQLAKHASKGVEKGAKTARSTRARTVAAIALVGGAGAVVARKLRGSGPEPLPYVPPEPVPPPPPVAPVPKQAAPPPVAPVPETVPEEPTPEEPAPEDGAPEDDADTDEPKADDET